MSHNWLFEALLHVMPALFVVWHKLSLSKNKYQEKRLRSVSDFCARQSIKGTKTNRAQRPSQLITVLSCHIICQHWVEKRCRALRLTGLLWAVRYIDHWPAWSSSSLQTCCWHLHWHRHISGNHRRMKGDKQNVQNITNFYKVCSYG